jgi:hypothetical protein
MSHTTPIKRCFYSPIKIQLINIDNTEDIIKYNSIHSAMKDTKLSYKRIKDYLRDNLIVNGYRWEIHRDQYIKDQILDLEIGIIDTHCVEEIEHIPIREPCMCILM